MLTTFSIVSSTTGTCSETQEPFQELELWKQLWKLNSIRAKYCQMYRNCWVELTSSNIADQSGATFPRVDNHFKILVFNLYTAKQKISL